MAPFLTDRSQYLKDVVRPLQEKEETVYVVPNSDAEEYLARRFPHKQTKRVGNGLNRLRSIQQLPQVDSPAPGALVRKLLHGSALEINDL
jgi:hypothetical protein